jgi:hypothetical protein
MANPQKAKGDAFEWAVINFAEELLADSDLTVERTRAGYARDYGDVLIKLPDDQILGTIQAKNRRKWEIPAWLDATQRQALNVRARFSALFVKRIGIADPGRSFAIMPADQWLRLLATLAERERELAEAHTALINLQCGPVPDDGPHDPASLAALRHADPDVLADEPGTVRGRQVYP